MNPQFQGIIGWYGHESQSSVRMISAIPDGKLNQKIHDKFRTAGELGMHLGDTIRDLTATFKTGKVVFTPAVTATPSKTADVVKHYNDALSEFMEASKNFTDEQLNKSYPFEMGGQVVWNPTGMELISGYICHEIHHRAQLGVVLRLVGAKVPGMYGPTADDM